MAELRFSPELGAHAPRMRVSLFNRDGSTVLRMVVPDGRGDERVFPSIDAALAAVHPIYRELVNG